MARYGFTSPGADAGQAIQQFLVQRAMQARQQQLDERAQQKQEQDATNQREQLKLEQERERRAAQTEKTQQAETARKAKLEEAQIAVTNAPTGGQSLSPGIIARIQGTPFEGRLQTQDTLPAQFGDPMNPQTSGSESFTSLRPTFAQEQAQGVQTRRNDLSTAVTTQGLSDPRVRNQIAADAVSAGQAVPAALLTQPASSTSRASIEQQYLEAIQRGDTKTAEQIKQAANIRDTPQGLFGATDAPDDVKLYADAIQSGNRPPTSQGLYGNTLKVGAELQRRGYDLTTANMDWQATQKHFATLNGAQQTRMRQAVDNASHSLDVIDDLASQWKGGKFPLLNSGRLAAAKSGALGPDAQQIATQLDAQIADVTSELANVYMGGNSPTDHAMELAAKNLQTNWTEAQLHTLVAQQRKNLTIRQNSIRNAEAVTPSSQAAESPAGASGGSLPSVGGTFQGGKVLKVERVK